MAVQLGKRYGRPTGEHDKDGNPVYDVELLCIKPGDGTCELNIGGIALELLQPKVLPSAD